MLTQRISRLSLAASGVALALSSFPAKADDLSDMRQEMQAMQRQYQAGLAKLQHDYETKLQSMEKRLDAAESKATAATQKADDAQKAAQAAQTAADTSSQTAAAAPAPGDTGGSTNAQSSANSFNPAIGAVLDGKGMVSTHNPNTWRLPGFALGDEAKPPPRGVSIGESEINLQANVDQALFANLTVAFENDNSVNIEEALHSADGVALGFHGEDRPVLLRHRLPQRAACAYVGFRRRTLPYMAFLNGQYGDDGIQLRWLAPTNMFIEFGGEAMRGASFPSNSVSEALTSNHNAGLGAWSAFLHVGDDINDSSSYSAGISYLGTRSSNRATDPVGGPPGSDQFTGVDHTFIADAVYKWAPNGNFAQSYVKLQGEAFARKESGAFTALNFASAPGVPTTHSLDSGIQTGFYAQAVYQFMPFWRVGVRYDQVHAPSLGAAFAGTTIEFTRSDAAPLFGDDRLLDQRVRPLPRAIQSRRSAARARQSAHPAIHRQPRRAWRPSVLRGHDHAKDSSPSLATFGVALLASAQAHAALNVFACEPEWGALTTVIGGSDVERLHRDDSAAGPAPDPGAAGADLAAAQCRPARLHRCRARDRLDAGAAAPGVERQGPAGPARLFRGHLGHAVCWRSRLGSIAPRAMSIPPAIRISRPIRATCARSRRR